VSELAELVAGIDKIRLRQSRAIARVIDRQRATIEAGEAIEDAGYDFAVAIVAAASDRSVAEIEELAGSILELGAAVTRLIKMAGFSAAGEAEPVAGADPKILGQRPRTGSGASGAPSPPASATPPTKSAR
jgi:hypothetical protein